MEHVMGGAWCGSSRTLKERQAASRGGGQAVRRREEKPAGRTIIRGRQAQSCQATGTSQAEGAGFRIEGLSMAFGVMGTR